MSTALDVLFRQAFPRDIRRMINALLERYEIGLICLAMGGDKEHFEAKLFASLRQKTKLHPEWAKNNGFRYIGQRGYVELINWLQKYPLGQKDIYCITYGASAAGQVDVLKCIESTCGGVDKEEPDYCRVAARRGQLESIKYLLNIGCVLGSLTEGSRTVAYYPYLEAIRFGHIDIVQFFVQQDHGDTYRIKNTVIERYYRGGGTDWYEEINDEKIEFPDPFRCHTHHPIGYPIRSQIEDMGKYDDYWTDIETTDTNDLYCTHCGGKDDFCYGGASDSVSDEDSDF
jgi:hypothetical protein